MQFKQIQESTGVSQFIKLEDKESIRGIFRGDPYDFKQHFIKAENKSYLCTAPQACQWCMKGDRPKFRFTINFITKEPDGKYIAKVFEQGAKFYNGLKALHESGYDLERTIMAVTRSGKGTDTIYTILPIPNGAVPDAMEKNVSAVKLHDLVNLKRTDETKSSDSESAESFDSYEHASSAIPF